MTEEAGMSGIHDCGGDAAAYVLGALDPVEAQAFERHLKDCAVCPDEVAALQQVANALPMAAPQHRAPKSLRRQVLATVRQEAIPARGTGRKIGRGRPSWAWRGIAVAGACASIALAIIAGADLSSGSGMRVIQARVAGISGSASVHLSAGRGELVVNHLTPPPPGDVYEMWLKRPGQPPAPTRVLFSVTSSGQGEIGLPQRLRGVTQIMVTPEPEGGSPHPTHSPVIVAPLT